MDVAEIEAKLKLKPRRRKRSILEFTRQFGWCITLAFRVSTINEHSKLIYHVNRTIDIFEITKCLVIRAMEGGTDIDVEPDKPDEIVTWEDWFEIYQWEMAQGITYEDCKETIAEIEDAIHHFRRVSDTIQNWTEDFDRMTRRIKSFET